MERINIEKIVEEGQKIVNEMYDLKIHQMIELGNIPDKVDLVYTSFLFGYLQGAKAVKAEMRKGGVVA